MVVKDSNWATVSWRIQNCTLLRLLWPKLNYAKTKTVPHKLHTDWKIKSLNYRSVSFTILFLQVDYILYTYCFNWLLLCLVFSICARPLTFCYFNVYFSMSTFFYRWSNFYWLMRICALAAHQSYNLYFNMPTLNREKKRKKFAKKY